MDFSFLRFWLPKMPTPNSFYNPVKRKRVDEAPYRPSPPWLNPKIFDTENSQNCNYEGDSVYLAAFLRTNARVESAGPRINKTAKNIGFSRWFRVALISLAITMADEWVLLFMHDGFCKIMSILKRWRMNRILIDVIVQKFWT